MEKQNNRKNNNNKNNDEKNNNKRYQNKKQPSTPPIAKVIPPPAKLSLPESGTDLKGPTKWCNWVIPGRLLMGAYPKSKTLIENILHAGITTFISLVHEVELKRLEPRGPYFTLCQTLVTENKAFNRKPTELQFIHLPIRDKDVTSDEEVINLVCDMEERLNGGENLFIHCRGGHGRTGTVVAILLSKMFKISGYEAMELCQEYHDHRESVAPRQYEVPQTTQQKNQVYRITAKYECNS
eukprot:TRINITY_DN10367_c0_g1_i7.p1 TRINITY_DN10367_c0_g1~~TRINITY_DN10367_c0_g1_i7.p1  ORF type:complete len:239 (+),score=34.28 TRINITY_DN10367_c0_g1_i7:96-812(+)